MSRECAWATPRWSAGDDVRTGVTVILPHAGNLFRDKVPGAVFVGNAFGKLAGSTQVEELGEIETPIALTSTLNVPRVADAIIDYMLALPGNEQVRSINPLVGETNDGYLNDIRGRHVGRAEVLAGDRQRARRRGRGGRGGRGHGHGGFRLQGRNRHRIAQGGRLHGGRAGAIEFRRHAANGRRAGGPRTAPGTGRTRGMARS